MKRFSSISSLIALIICGLFLVTACGQSNGGEEQEETGAYPEIPPIFAFGQVKAKNIQNVTIDFSATLDELSIGEGQVVAEGDVLAVLDLTDYSLQVKNKELELNMEKIELERQLSNMAKARNELVLAESMYQLAVEELKKYEILFQEGAIAQSELEQFQRTAKEREMALSNLQLALGGEGESPEVRLQRQKIALLENQLQQMRKKLEKDYLKENEVIAYVEQGVVYDLGYRPGDTIVPEKKLFSLADLDSIVVEAEVSEEFLDEIEIGSRATITPLADRSRSIPGRVTGIAGKTEERKGETVVLVEIGFDKGDGIMLPGFNVDVEIAK